jgi:hypothetical protein
VVAVEGHLRHRRAPGGGTHGLDRDALVEIDRLEGEAPVGEKAMRARSPAGRGDRSW